MGVAGRYENYSDFGSTANGKVSARLRATDDISIRGAASSGFRAPSLHQLNYNATSTLFVDGVPFEVGVFDNKSRAAQLLGIPQLKQERSVNFSGGVTAKVPAANLSITVDGYLIDINDRVVLTGQFGGAPGSELDMRLRQANASKATFFVNAIDTRTRGLDVVVAHQARFNASTKLNSTLAATFAKTELKKVNTSGVLAGLESTYFDETSRIFLESAVPRTKVNLTFDLTVGKFTAFLRNVYFGPVNEATNVPANMQTFDGKVITDLSVGYKFNDRVGFTIGANNLLDVYPDLNLPANQGDG